MNGESNVQVLLIVPPFYTYGHPSLGTAVLKSALAQRGITSRVLYANAAYARQIGLDFYREIMSVVSPDELYQEQIFSRSAHGDFAPSRPAETHGGSFYSRYYQLFSHKKSRLTPQELAQAIDGAEAFLDQAVAEIAQSRPAIVGLSSLYSQVNASLALAKAIKRALPETVVVIGGSNCYGEMGEELARQPHLDYVFDGEADVAFPDFCERLLRDGDRPAEKLIRCLPVQTLEEFDIPDYSDFLEQFAPEERDIFLYFETSRGCWWGVKNRCRFCGISYDGMAFRTKSARKAASHLSEIRKRYPEYTLFYGCDSVFPNSYFDDFFQELGDRGFDGTVFYQIKPMFDFDKLSRMKEQGITILGPGIESLSTKHLKMMKKGTTAARNITVLRNCKEIGIEAKWNHLVALPNDSADDYRQIADLIPLLQHLDPPVITPIYIQRFSPYFDQREDHGITDIRPMEGYLKSFPPGIDLMKLAYNFTGDMASDIRGRPELLARFMLEIRKWYDRWSARPAELVVYRDGGRLRIRDTRDCAVDEVVDIDEADLDLLRSYRSFRPKGDAGQQVDALVRRGFIAEIDGGFLTLVCGTHGMDAPVLQ
ncbi:RiPP maturation radical SAM C-methyltransferase [Azospirillum picis]|uniref:Ribosomal peptide maturation radical SAM protein 1 n=1 Tax=Azospirillum picis TaxID=488438 RepID=A0ABU0MVJ0_9PROT|nr:RiPP maturation radical SAM C-methyltransferase [Azospirillum picis]MBP2303368.1 ribosomal peptide maturation radical SAM protein 1 [Azospirillum picis]MDQ0537209.1 ribosomal peptide maturation radical SAM protein 1 [Azospirillum picis]